LRDSPPRDTLQLLLDTLLKGGALHRTVILGAAAALLLVMSPSIAGAQDWQDAFPPTVLETYLPPGGQTTVVMAVGSDDATRAAESLSDAIAQLRGDVSVRTISIESATATDKAALERHGLNAPEISIVVRVFEQPPRAPTAVVAVYRGVERYDAFAVEHGERLESRGPTMSDRNTGGSIDDELTADDLTDGLHEEPKKSASEGVSADAAESVSETVDEIKENFESRLRTFSQGVISVSYYERPPESAPRRARPNRFYRGTDMERISAEEFLREVERPDLLARYRDKQRRRKVGIAISAGVVGVGLTAAALGASQVGGCSTDAGWCPVSTVLFASGGILAFGGVISMVATSSIRPFPVQIDEAQRLAEEHNDDLRQSLNLDDDVEFEPDWGAVSLDIGISRVENGAGLTIRGRF
jgi:hypothetical protein